MGECVLLFCVLFLSYFGGIVLDSKRKDQNHSKLRGLEDRRRPSLFCAVALLVLEGWTIRSFLRRASKVLL